MSTSFPFTTYATATGKIEATGTTSVETVRVEFEDMFPGKSIVPQLAPNTDDFYVSVGAVVPRPVLSITATKLSIKADGVDEAVLSGFPDICNITVNGVDTTISQTVTVRSRAAGTFELSCEMWPYMLWTATIEATA